MVLGSKAQYLVVVRMRRNSPCALFVREQLQWRSNVRSVFKRLLQMGNSLSEMKDMFWDSDHHDSDA